MYFIYGSDKKVRLKPVNLDVVSEEVSYKLGSEINFDKSFLGNGKFNIKSYEFGEKFNHNYSYQVMNQTFNASITISSVNKIILNLVIDSGYSNNLSNFSFLSTYATLKYKIDDVEYSSSFTDKTPNSYNDGVYLAVDKKVMEADNIWFDIVLRNKRYVYNIK